MAGGIYNGESWTKKQREYQFVTKVESAHFNEGGRFSLLPNLQLALQNYEPEPPQSHELCSSLHSDVELSDAY